MHGVLFAHKRKMKEYCMIACMKKTHGQRLKEFREAAGLSQRELARKIGVTYSNISFWEGNDIIPRSDVLTPIAQTLGISTEDLLGNSSPKKKLPSSRLWMAFDRASKLSRRQQQKLVDFVDLYIEQNTQKNISQKG